MSSLRKRLELPPRERSETVKYFDETYIVSGIPSGGILVSSLIPEPGKHQQLARHWSKLVGGHIDADAVKQILIIHATLQPEPGENPYAREEIAKLYVQEGPLFLMLYMAAGKVLGMNEGIEVVMEKNSETPEDSEWNSTSGSSEAGESPSASSEGKDGAMKKYSARRHVRA